MKNFFRFAALALITVAVVACLPKPSTDTVDLSKTRATLMLTDGSAISSDEYDDKNPILIRMPDESLVLLFESNRPCDPYGCDGSYNIFIAQSEEPYYGYEIPAFYDPVPVNASGSAHNISGSPFNFQATYNAGFISILLQNGPTIDSLSIAEPAIPAGDTISPSMPVPNVNRYNDTLVHLDTRTFQMISFDGAGDLYLSRINDPTDTGTPIYNYELGYANNAARVVPAISGFTDAVIYEYFGYLAFGQHDDIGYYMYSFNNALDRENLELSYVSVMHMFASQTELLLFSAGEPGGQHDLYAVDSHTLEELWFQDAYIGFDDFYSDNFSIYLASAMGAGYDGDLRTAGGGSTGIQGADNICNSDTGQPDINVYYKAMMVDNAGNRVATVTGPAVGNGQVDWVLSPFTSYFQSGGGVLIGMSDSVGLLTSNSAGVFPGGVIAWTGFAASGNWTAHATNHCSNWSNNSAGNGAAGIANVTTGNLINNASNPACNTAAPALYCVEQPYY